MKRAPLKLPPGTVGIAQAKRDLIALINQVLSTKKPVTIARRGKPVVRLEPVPPTRRWIWSPEHAIPEGDPFWEGEKRTAAWRNEPWTRGPRRKQK